MTSFHPRKYDSSYFTENVLPMTSGVTKYTLAQYAPFPYYSQCHCILFVFDQLIIKSVIGFLRCNSTLFSIENSILLSFHLALIEFSPFLSFFVFCGGPIHMRKAGFPEARGVLARDPTIKIKSNRKYCKLMIETQVFGIFLQSDPQWHPVAQPEGGGNWAFAPPPPWRFGKPYVNLQI